ncbi:hypothetical protein [Thermococcus sp. ES12]|uniref:hypothetical protein n=1 Tax=Thermococcus sp. ES12 TaxID=1638246 RepID=UPI001431AF92|nr:hypothetical protein [Thermococcus sp. ES12]NJE75954.1 hypothetical protein [Thermococcus sp. ES12]
MVAARAAMVYAKPEAGPELFKDFYEHMRREILTSENKMVFSRTLDFLFGRGEFSVYDIDAIVFDWQVKRYVSAFELKFKSWKVAKPAWLDGYLEVNGYQFIRVKRLARLLRVPLYYFVQVGHYPKARYVLFDPLKIRAELERKYEGTYAEDLYALIPLDDAIVSKSIEDLRTDLGLLLGR